MSSDWGRPRSAASRQRLHSVTFLCLRRVIALLFAADALRVSFHLWSGSPLGVRMLSEVLHLGAVLLLAYHLWFGGRVVFAAERGLELVSGGTIRVIPWQCVSDLREMPWMTLHPPWYPKLYQLDLSDGEAIAFVGRRDARAIVAAALQRARVVDEL